MGLFSSSKKENSSQSSQSSSSSETPGLYQAAAATFESVTNLLCKGRSLLCIVGSTLLVGGLIYSLRQSSQSDALTPFQFNENPKQPLGGNALPEVEFSPAMKAVMQPVSERWQKLVGAEPTDDFSELYSSVHSGKDTNTEENSDPLEGFAELFHQIEEPQVEKNELTDSTAQQTHVVREVLAGAAPVLANNTLGEMTPGEEKVLGPENIAVTDLDTLPSDLTLELYDIQEGLFSVNGTTVPSSTTVHVTQEDINNGVLGLKHNNKNKALTFSWGATDNLGNTIGPFRPRGIFTGYGFIGEPFQVTSSYTYSLHAGAPMRLVAALSSDKSRVMTVWDRMVDHDPIWDDVFGQLLNSADGSKYYVHDIVIANGTNSQKFSRVKSRDSNGFVVTHRYNSYDDSILGEYYDANAVGDGDVFTIVPPMDFDFRYALEIFTDDGFRVGYIADGGSPDYYTALTTQSFYSNTTARKSVAVHDGAINMGVGSPGLTRLHNDNQLLTWLRRSDGHYGHILDYDDNVLVGPCRLTSVTYDSDVIPLSVAVLDNSRFNTVYRDENPLGSRNWQVHWGQFNALNLARCGDDEILDSYYRSSQNAGQQPSEAFLGNGISATVWENLVGPNVTVFIQPRKTSGERYGERFWIDTNVAVAWAEESSIIGLGDVSGGRGMVFYRGNRGGDVYGYDGRIIGPTVAPSFTAPPQMTLSPGERITVNATMIDVTDPDTPPHQLIITPIVTGGQFEYKNARGTPVTSFTMADVISNNDLEFVQMGGRPSVELQVKDRVLSSARIPMVITYNVPVASSSASPTSPTTITTPSQTTTTTPSQTNPSTPTTVTTTTTTIPTTVTTTPSQTTVTSHTQTTSTTENPSSESDLSITTKSSSEPPNKTNFAWIAGVIGGVVGVAVCTGIAVGAHRAYKKRKDRENRQDDIELQQGSTSKGGVPPQQPRGAVSPGQAQSAPARVQSCVNPSVPDVATIDYRALEVDQTNGFLGEGTFGYVYRAARIVRKGLTEPVVVKVLKEGIREFFGAEFIREAETLGRLRHPNVVSFIGVCQDPFCIVMEYVSGGSLDKLLKEKSLDWPTRLRYVLDVVCGLEYLHEQEPPVLHRDIKPANVLVGDIFIDGAIVRVAKLGDFGSARKIVEVGEKQKTIGVGTPSYQAPEMMNGQGGVGEYSTAADIHSTTVVLWEGMTQEQPYNDSNTYPTPWAISNAVCAGRRLEIPQDPTPGGVEITRRIQPKSPQGYADLITWGWTHEPKGRPTARQMRERLEILEAEVRQNSQRLPYGNLPSSAQTLPPQMRR